MGLSFLLSRPGALVRTARKLGWPGALKLAYIRALGRSTVEYRLRIKGYPYKIALRGGKSTDARVLHQLLVMGEYGFYGELEKPPSVIIDGGANIGIGSIYFLNRYPTSRVLAIEPAPDTFALCAKNLAPYGDRVKLYEGAMWTQPGKLVLKLDGEEWKNSVEAASSEHIGSIEAYTIPQLIADAGGHVDLLKIDIEGAEREVFGPKAREWLPCVRNIVIELHDGECESRFFDSVSGYRYDLRRKREDHPPVVACLGLCPSTQVTPVS